VKREEPVKLVDESSFVLIKNVLDFKKTLLLLNNSDLTLKAETENCSDPE
jgi:hypothetical protein